MFLAAAFSLTRHLLSLPCLLLAPIRNALPCSTLHAAGGKRHGRSANQQKVGYDVIFLASPRFTASTFDAVVGPDGNYFQGLVSNHQRDALLISAPAVVDAVKKQQLQFAVKKSTVGSGACGHGATGYTLSNEALKKLGFRITKWKHIDPLPSGEDADKYEDAVAWIDIPVV